MKLILLLSICFFLEINAGYSQSGSVFCMGNGDYCVYEEGVNVIQVFGPPYSSASPFKVTLLNSDVRVVTQRKQGTAVYIHTLYRQDRKIGTITDFVSSCSPCFCRMTDLTEPVSFSLNVSDPADWQYKMILTDKYAVRKEDYKVNNGLVVTALPGVYVYHTYPSPFETNHQIFVKGAAELTSKEDQEKVYDLRFGKGKGLFYLIGGPSYQDLNSHVEEVLKQKPENLLNRTIADWHTFSGTRSQFDKLISNQNANKTELLKAVDDVSVLLKTQQGREGGVLAGHYYHLAYVRDEYGVSRALLALGYVEQARKILQFYYDLWRQYGHISNAQAIGVPGIFHRHENDEVEITGYILIQAFDYFGKTKNQKFIKEMMPFLEWCWEAQKKNLVDNMLPFNGDETYIAGGMIPRKVLNDGSSEATLLFIEGGRKFISFIERLKCKDREWILKNKGILDTTVEHYRENFMRDGKLLVNNPRRAVLCNYPETRYGVCLYPGHGGYQGLLNHYKGYMYFCQECSQKPTNQIKLEEPEEFFLPSSYLMPIYIGSTLFSKDEKEGMLKELIKLYQKTGKITINQQDERLLGYDYGLFLYALTEFNHPLAGEIYRKMMDLRDGSGAWVEYYNGKEPSGCRYRPWESGINIEAAIHYVGRH